MSTESQWPLLPHEAYHGLLGQMLQAITPETEADPAGVLLGWLCCFGSCVGRGAWLAVGPDVHYPTLYVGIVGATSARKGMGFSVVKWPFVQADPIWGKLAICNGVGSGQGLIERVRDESRAIKLNKKTGLAEEQIVPAAADKRCLLRLDELAICFKLQRSEGSTLGETLLTAWAGVPLDVLNRSGNDLRTTDYSITVMGDTQPGTLRKLLEKGMEQYNGWLNRFLWVAVKRNGSLPMGGKITVLDPLLERLKSAITFAQQVGQLSLNAEAETVYGKVYDGLVLSGDSVLFTERAAPYVLRLSMLFALADSSKFIRKEHLEAALALWSYCRASAKVIFGSQQVAEVNAEADPLWLQLMNAIGRNSGISRTGLREVVGHKVSAQAIEEALSQLEAKGLAFRLMVKPKGKGSPAEWWYLGVKPEGESGLVDNPSFFPFETEPVASDSTSAEAGREEITLMLHLVAIRLRLSLQAMLWLRLKTKDERELLSSLPPSPAETNESSLGETVLVNPRTVSSLAEAVIEIPIAVSSLGEGELEEKEEGVVNQKLTPKPILYASAEAVEREVIRRGGSIKNLDGQYKVMLPEPDAELEAAWLRLDGISEAEFVATLKGMR